MSRYFCCIWLFLTAGTALTQPLVWEAQETFLRELLWQRIKDSPYNRQISGPRGFVNGSINTGFTHPDTVFVQRDAGCLQTHKQGACITTDYFTPENSWYKMTEVCGNHTREITSDMVPGKKETTRSITIEQYEGQAADTITRYKYTERAPSGMVLRQTADIFPVTAISEPADLETRFFHARGKLVRKTSKNTEGMEIQSWKIQLGKELSSPVHPGKRGETVVATDADGKIIYVYYTTGKFIFFLWRNCVIRNNEVCNCDMVREIHFYAHGLPHTDTFYEAGKFFTQQVFYYE